MKLKKLTALLATASMALSLSPMAVSAADPIYTFDAATNTFNISETVVPGDIKVKEAGADDSTYNDSVTVKFEGNSRNFDFKATLDMAPVQEKFNAALDIIRAKGRYEEFKSRKVKGEFVVTVIPQDPYIVIPEADVNGNNMAGFTTSSDIYVEKSRVKEGNNLKITVGLKDDVTVEKLTEADALADIAYVSLNVPVLKAGTIKIKGTVSGYIETEDLEGTSDINAKASFVAKEDNSTEIFATIKSKTNGGLSGGSSGGSTTTKKEADVVFYNGNEKHLEETVDITDGAYTFDLSAVAVPEAQKKKIFMGWYKDKACTVAASAKESITKNTNFYAGWLDTKYNIGFVIDGNEASVNTATTGSIAVGREDIIPGEEGTEIKVPNIKVVGATITGWFLDKELTIPLDDSIVITEDTVLYASTKPIDVPSILEKGDHFAYIIGYPEGDVRPENSITREEVATIFFRLLTEEIRNENKTSENDFKDIEDTRWSNNAISTMSKLGIVNGYEDGTFGPDKAITRAEFATIAARFEEQEVENSVSFTDIEGHWAEEYIKEVAALQWVNGYEDGTFRPQNSITRAEVMTIVNRMLQRSVSSEYILSDAVFWTDNDESAWYYEAVMEATNSHEYERLAEGMIEERWTAMKANRDWSELEK